MVRFTDIRQWTGTGPRWRAIAVAAFLVAGVAACSSSSSSGPPASSAPATSSAPAVAASSAAGGLVSDYHAYVGGNGKADTSLSPVTIGFLNQQGGPPTQNFPQSTAAANAVVKMINTELGGVHGHPVQLNTCFIKSSEAEGTTCGQQFLNAKGVQVIADGIQAVGNASMYSVLKGAIPVLIGVSANPADDTAKNVFELEGSGTSATVAFGPFLKSQYPNAKTIAIAYANQPGALPISDAMKSSFTKSGFTVTMLPYSPNATDLLGPVTQMEQADIAVPACGFVDCPLVAKAIHQISGTKPVLSVPLWTFLPPPAYPGGDLPKWLVGEATANLAYTAAPDVGAYFAKSAQYGLSHADALSPFSGVAWGNILLAVKLMNEIPFAQITPDAITAKLRAYSGGIPLGPPSINCSGTLFPSAPAACSVSDQFFVYNGGGQWKLLQAWTKQPGS